MDDMLMEIVTMSVINSMNNLIGSLHVIPLYMLKRWYQWIKNELVDTPEEEKMRQMHITIIGAYIEGREFAIQYANDKIKNN